MAKRNRVLLNDVPTYFQALSDRLEKLSADLYSKRETVGLTGTENRDWDRLLGYWRHVEILDNQRDRNIEPAIDPLALLDVAEKFNLAAPKQISRLRQEFTSRVEKIVGHSLTPQQVSQMHKLLTGFNPAKPK